MVGKNDSSGSYTYFRNGSVPGSGIISDSHATHTGVVSERRGGATNAFAYNAFGSRVSAVDSLGTRTIARNGTGVTSPILSDGAANYTPGVSERRGGVTKHQSADIKNATDQLSTSQSIAASKQYDAFGNLTNSSGTWSGQSTYGGSFGYQSEPDSGLMLLGHRYYDPSIGRFLSRDPIGDGENWYGYCGGNPVRFSDPMGLEADGHHIVGKIVREMSDLSAAAKDIFRNAKTGNPGPGGIPGHGPGYGAPHREYDKAVAKEFDKYCKKNGISRGAMTRTQALDFVKEVMNSKNKVISKFLSGIAKGLKTTKPGLLVRVMGKAGRSLGIVLTLVIFMVDAVASGPDRAARNMLFVDEIEGALGEAAKPIHRFVKKLPGTAHSFQARRSGITFDDDE
ncbi:MAG: RHS repeat-associated core domain-containing protein [Fimbriimonadales bacterium]